jgi:hypothetical protein
MDLGDEGELEDTEETSLPKELAFVPSFQKRSRGTMQHASYEWTQHKAAYSDGHYVLAIASYKRWQRKVKRIPISVVVRLEDLGRKIPIYSHVRVAVEVET